MYVGNLRAVGSISQYSAVDATEPFGLAHGLLLRMLQRDHDQRSRNPARAHLPLLRVPLLALVTEGGPGYVGRDFRRTCDRLGV